MCGINGFSFKDISLIKKMSQLTQQRGPDHTGFYTDDFVSLSHNRLSILDPHERSNQPFVYKNYVTIFNGEIYNYKELSNFLEEKGYKIQTSSDTEVIIKLFHLLGIESFKKLKGIFAISIYNKAQNKIYLIRDLIGVKNLYYTIEKNKFYFSSLINPLKKITDSLKLNKEACNNYFNFNRNDGRETFYKKIFKVMPGELITFSKNQMLRQQILEFSFKKNILFSKKGIKNKIENIIHNQFISDVPVALSLSGGVDSNLIRKVLSKHKNFKCYSVYFKVNKNKNHFNHDFNFAEKVCLKSKIDFTSVECNPQIFQDSIEDVNDVLEEPAGNPNSIINFLLSKKINEKVIFTGDGGDEIFGGYHRYKSMYLISILKKISFFKKIFPLSEKNYKRLSLNNADEFYLSFGEQNLFKEIDKYYPQYENINSIKVKNNFSFSNNFNLPKLNNYMLRDLETWIVNDVCLRNDKIYSNKGIEARVPFLDEEMINNFILYPEFKKYGIFFNDKKILKNIMKGKDNYLKRKYGFNPPFASWLKDELYNFALEILNKNYYNSNHLINLENARKLVNTHKQKYYNPYLLWNLINFQIFLKQNNF